MFDSSEERPVWAWIDLAALRHNARRAIECAAGRTVIGVVKADGYGHGGSAIARGLLAEGVSRLAVVSVREAAALRRAGIVAPILLLGGLNDAGAAERALKLGLTPVLHDQRDFELARTVGRRGSPLSVEVEIDTGMRRMGVPVDSARALIAQIADTPQLVLSGVFTHLANADHADIEASRAQVEALAKIHRDLGGGARPAPEVHVANSAGLLRLAAIETRETGIATSGVRPGLMLYGVSPFADRSAEALDLEPVMTVATQIISVRALSKGDFVGYGGEWQASRATRIATLPIGYADGMPRSLLGRGKVFVAGAMRPIVGRVSMDYVTVDLGDAAVVAGEVATIFGRTPDGLRIPVEDFARMAGTIAYEILVGIGARVPRETGLGLPPAGDVGPLDRAV